MSLLHTVHRYAMALCGLLTIFVATSSAQAVTLGAVVFLANSDAVIQAGWAVQHAGTIDVSRVPELAPSQARSIVEPYFGKEIDDALLVALRSAVQKHFRVIHQPFVDVTIPKQDVTNGVLQLVVVVSRVGNITVEGNRWFDQRLYLDAVHLRPDGPIDSALLAADTERINNNPYRRVTIVAQPGERFGTTDFVIRTEERIPYSVSVGMDNTGSKATSQNRVNVGFDWGNAFGRGDNMNYRHNASPSGKVRQHSLSYTTALRSRHTLSLSGSAARSVTDVANSPISNIGRNTNFSIHYTIPFPANGIQQHVSLGYEYKRTNNDILFGGISVFPTTLSIQQFTANYSRQTNRSEQTGGLDLSVVVSPGNLSSRNTDTAFASQQVGAPARYLYGRATMHQQTDLPFGFTWDIRAMLQLSAHTLLPSEQFSLGGSQLVRGFAEQAGSRDNGVLLKNELRMAVMQPRLPERLGLNGEPDQFMVFMFLDAGVGWNHRERGAFSSRVRLVSAGPGMQYQFSRYGSLRLTCGVPLESHGLVGNRLKLQFSLNSMF